MSKITKRLVDSTAPGAREVLVWDDDLSGFGLRVTPTGIKSFIVQYRTRGAQTRRMTIGRANVITPDEARKAAREILVDVLKGADPCRDRRAWRQAPTMDDLLTRYLEEHVAAHNAAGTAKENKRLVETIIRPRLGARKVAEIQPPDIARLHASLVNTPRQANLVLSVLSKVFGLAEVWGARPASSSPCTHVKRYPENKRERSLSPPEIARLGAALRDAETVGVPFLPSPDEVAPDAAARVATIEPSIIAAFRVLLFTGARLSEIIGLEWAHVDTAKAELSLPRQKGKPRRAHPVGKVAIDVITALGRVGESPWVFPRLTDPGRSVSPSSVEKAWSRLRLHAGLADVRIHDLRHTVGSWGSEAGGNAFVLRDLLRHEGVAVTSGYVNDTASPVRALSEVVSGNLSAALDGRKRGKEPSEG